MAKLSSVQVSEQVILVTEWSPYLYSSIAATVNFFHLMTLTNQLLKFCSTSEIYIFASQKIGIVFIDLQKNNDINFLHFLLQSEF